jgi:tetratricopeptide (TPR) repeat protein
MRCLILAGALACGLFAQEQALREAARLDAEQKCDEAERIYEKVLAGGPPSPALLNNIGNHYVACRQPDKARTYFERLLKINPGHVNAHLQLGQIAESLPHDEAAALIDELAKTAGTDPRLLFALGLTAGRIGFYDKAEATFSTLLARIPGDFDVLYNLGLASARAGHYDRAQRTFEAALKARPNDVDTLYELGRVEANMKDYNRAIYLLVQARKLAPKRPEIMLALARAAQMAGYYGDSILAYDDYLKLRPEDDPVRGGGAFKATAGQAESKATMSLHNTLRNTPKTRLGSTIWPNSPIELIERKLSRGLRPPCASTPSSNRHIITAPGC